MNTRPLGFAAALAAALVAGGASVLAVALAPAVASAQGFNAVFSHDGADVWAAGDAGMVFRSLDGGVVWSAVPIGTADHNGVASNGTRVWLVDDGGTLWTSTNNGVSFASASIAGPVDLNAIGFADASTGWIAGNSGTILKTTNAGASWFAQTSGTAANLNAIRFASLTEGWACGASGTVVHTTNGGTSWIASTPFAFTKALFDVDLVGSTVYVSGTYGFLAKSTNAGGSWTPIDLRIDSRSDVNGVELLASGTLWLCGGGGFLRSSTDGAQSFSFAMHPIVTGMTDVFFFSATTGWACARTSRNVARTTDGGATWSVPGGGAFTYSWTRMINNASQSIRGNTMDIDPVNREKLYAVQGRLVFASWDVGATWARIDTIPGAATDRTNAFYVSGTDSNTWVAAVQDNDRITRTTDGGVNWTTTLNDSVFTEYGTPLEQDPNDPDVLYFGLEDGTIRKSTDFGVTWATLSSPGFRSPCDIAAVADTTGILYLGDGVTDSGQSQLFRSSDGGLNWSLLVTGTTSEIPAIASSWLDNRVAYATHWNAGGVRRSTDWGESWPVAATTVSAWGVDVAKDDPYVAIYGVYSGNTSYLTTDGGASFQPVTTSQFGANYGVLVYDRGTYLEHNGTGIWKAAIVQPGMPVDNTSVVTLATPGTGTPARFELRGSAPNPFGAGGTAIGYALPTESAVRLVVYNAAGQEVATLVNERQPRGVHSVRFPTDVSGRGSATEAFPSGVYFYRLTAGEFAATRRMILVR